MNEQEFLDKDKNKDNVIFVIITTLLIFVAHYIDPSIKIMYGLPVPFLLCLIFNLVDIKKLNFLNLLKIETNTGKLEIIEATKEQLRIMSECYIANNALNFGCSYSSVLNYIHIFTKYNIVIDYNYLSLYLKRVIQLKLNEKIMENENINEKCKLLNNVIYGAYCIYIHGNLIKNEHDATLLISCYKNKDLIANYISSQLNTMEAEIEFKQILITDEDLKFMVDYIYNHLQNYKEAIEFIDQHKNQL